MKNLQQSKKPFFFSVLLAILLFLVSGTVFGQSTAVTLEGKVTDEQGNALPGTSVVVKNVETGYVYTAISRPDGGYIISGVQPGNYEIEVSLSGFATQKRLGLTFNIGARLTIDFSLTPATIKEEMTVTAPAPMVEMTKSDISSVVDRKKIDDLPLLDRDFGTLISLKAGVGDGRVNAQPRGGSEMLVDGVSNTRVAEQRIRMGFPADAIQEFRVMTNQFQAEYGNASGMLQTTLTRSGTNKLRGRASFFYRDEVFDDVNYFVNHKEYKGAELPKDEWEKSPYEHYNFSGFLGGPIKKDKAHFFIAYEGLRHEDYATVTSPLVPREAVPVKTTNNQLFLKLNYQLNEKNLFTFRFGLNRPFIYNNLVGGYYTKERGVDWLRTEYDFQVSWTLFPSNNSVNELRLLYSREEAPINAKDPDAYTINRPSGFFGHNFNFPQQSNEDRFQIVNNFSLFLGKHSLKFGIDMAYLPYTGFIHLWVPGEFTFLTDKPFNPNDFSTYPFTFLYNAAGIKDIDWPYSEAGFFVQDSWKVHPRLTLNLGLRFNHYTCKGLDLDNWNIRNLNPRFGFSWDPIGDGKTSIRGGIGTFSANPALIAGLVGGFLGSLDLRLIIFPNYPDPFKPNPFFPSISGAVSVGTYGSMENQIAPYSVQPTLGFEREVFTDFSVGADLVWAKGYRLVRWENENPIIPGTSSKRKKPGKGDEMVITDGGRSDYKGLYLTLVKRYSRGWSLDVAYTLSKSMSDVEVEDDTTGVHNYEENGWERQYGLTNNDARHRIAVTGIVDLPLGFQLSGLFYYRSALPWNALYLTDVNKDGKATDYVDEHRNSRSGFDYYTLNVRISKFIDVDRFRLHLFAEAYNLTNKTNFGGSFSVYAAPIYNRYGTPNFGKPAVAGSPRQIQLGVRIDF